MLMASGKFSYTRVRSLAALPGATQVRAGLGAARLRRDLGAAGQSASGSRRRQGAAAPPRAMVNVDVSPSVILGVGLIGAGVSLWQIRQARPWISKDYDVVISCISLLVGGILIFQVRCDGVTASCTCCDLFSPLSAWAWPTPPAADALSLCFCRAGGWTLSCCLGS
jgi:hypothetical protein